jgi:hypothetical protein
MNSIQLAHRLGRNLRVDDPFNLPADAALDVLAAMNGGLSAFYRVAPGILKRSTLSHTIRAPRALTVAFLAQYLNLVAADTFEAREMGCTVKFGNGSADNVVTGPSSLLDDYLGSTLSVAATVYSDAVPVQDVIEQIVGHVRLYDNTQNQPTYLIRDEVLAGRSGVRGAGEGFYAYSGGLYSGVVGRPRYYYFEPMGVSQGVDPEFVLRVSPLPDIDYTVRMEAELSTQRLVFADLTTARPIYVGDSHLDDVVIPLCEAELLASPFWRDNGQRNAVLQRAEVALGKMGKLPREVAPVSHRSGTPPGF